MSEELLRRCLELATASGKKYQNSESGLVILESGVPIYENFLFCLALFRSKTHESVFEAKKLLERLLYFQQQFVDVPWRGNFPLLVTDFPYCKEHLQAARCSTVLLLILKEFHHILGQELNNKIKRALELSVQFCQKIAEEVAFPQWAALKIAACIAAFEPSLVTKWPDLSDQSDLRSWADPAHLAEMILAYQIGHKALPQLAWEHLWHYLSKSYHVPSHSYIGPAYKVKDEVTLYDYFLGLFTGSLSKRVDKVQLQALSASMLQLDNKLEPCALPFAFSQERWSIYQEPDWASSILTGSFRKEEMYGLYPYSFVVGEYSCVIQPQSGYLSKHEGAHRLYFEVPEEVFCEEKQKSDLLSIWFDDRDGVECFVNGKLATCFSLTDPVEIRLGDCTIKLSFELVSGEGSFKGHIRRGSRIGQRKDVHLCIRAVRGASPCQLKLETYPTLG